MENASKALLIAAAVLIVILLIAFGMRIFNSSKDAADPSEAAATIGTGVTDAGKDVKYTMMAGKNKLGSECKTIAASALGDGYTITLKNGTTTTAITTTNSSTAFTDTNKYDMVVSGKTIIFTTK